MLDIANINQYIKEHNISVTKQESKKRGTKESAIDLDNVGVSERNVQEDAIFKKYKQLFSTSAEFEGVGELRLLLEEKVTCCLHFTYIAV